MKIKFISSGGTLELDDIKSITFTSADGQRTVMNKHIDTTLALGLGAGYIVGNDQVKHHFVMKQGIAVLERNVMTLIPEHIVFTDSTLNYSSNKQAFENDEAFMKVLRRNGERD